MNQPIPRTTLLSSCLLVASFLFGCDGGSSPGVQEEPVVDDQVRVMQSYWEGTEQVDFWYEMRPNEDGMYARNGKARAYYKHGQLQREGQYRNNKRVGVWTFYKPDGSFDRTNDYGSGQ